MKGFLVWNESIADNEFFGFYRSKERAEYILRKIKKHRYPHMNEDEIDDYESEHGESIKISYIDETNGKTYSIKKGV